jgi:hypothetical protein
MNLIKILSKVGGGIFKNAVPGGKAILATVNEFLPSDKKLSDQSTGHDIADHLDHIPEVQRAELLARQFDVKIEQVKQEAETIRAMLAADASSTHTTRPYIAKHSFHLIAIVSLIVIGMWAYAVGTGNAVLVKSVMDGWRLVAAVILPFVLLLYAYFGILKKEHDAKLTVANGESPVSGIINTIIKKIK